MTHPMPLRDVILDALRNLNQQPQPTTDSCCEVCHDTESDDTGGASAIGRRDDDKKSDGQLPGLDERAGGGNAEGCGSVVADNVPDDTDTQDDNEYYGMDAGFEESEHPRGKGEHGGEFVKKGTGQSELPEPPKPHKDSKPQQQIHKIATGTGSVKERLADIGAYLIKNNIPYDGYAERFAHAWVGHLTGTKPTDAPKTTGKSVTYTKKSPPPAELHGLAFKSWKAPKTNEDWETLVGDGVDEPDLPLIPKGFKQGAGVFIKEPDGRIWLIKPTNGFGGYKYTWPKGGVEKGMSLQGTAIKEAYEETGLHVELTGYAGDMEHDVTESWRSHARYYYAKRVGGTPTDASWESEGVALVQPDELHNFLNKTVDRTMAAKFLGVKNSTKDIAAKASSTHDRLFIDMNFLSSGGHTIRSQNLSL